MKKLLILGVVLGIIGMLLFACSGGGHHSKTNENNGGNGEALFGTWYSDPENNNDLSGLGVIFIFEEDGTFKMQGAHCNDPAPCYITKAGSTYTATSGELNIDAIPSEGKPVTITANYSINDDELILTDINGTPFLPTSMTMLREGSFIWTTIVPDTGTFTVDGQNTGGNETTGITSFVDDSGDNNTDHIGIGKVYFARNGDSLFVQAQIAGGYNNAIEYNLYFNRDGDYGINDYEEMVSINWTGGTPSPDTVLNTKWLVGGPDNIDVHHPIADVRGCKVGSVIEFQLDLSKLGDPSSLLMSFWTNEGDSGGDSISTIKVKF